MAQKEAEHKPYLRNIKDGFIYRWHPILAKHPLCEGVTEEEAFPERFLNREQADSAVNKRKARGRKALDLNTEIDDTFTSPELDAEATKRPFKRSGQAGVPGGLNPIKSG